MNILFIVRSDTYSVFGGDTVQFEKTKGFLENLYKVNIKIVLAKDAANESLENIDIIHIWGLHGGAVGIDEFLERAKEKNIKIVLSSIYWNLEDTFFFKYFYQKIKIPASFIPIARTLFSFLLGSVVYNFVPKFSKNKKYFPLHKDCLKRWNNIIQKCDIIIPNSTEEGALLYHDTKISDDISNKKTIVIPNAIDVEFIKNHKDNGYMNEVKDFVIEAAGIEPLKNQLSVVKALYDFPEIPIIFAGGIRDEKYYAEIKQLADNRGNVYFTGKIPFDDLFSLYKRARVHVLSSFRESPGLVTLEALICGSQIVVSEKDYCPINYYKFDKYGFLCNPYYVKSIRKAVLNAYNNPKDNKANEDYINFFSYENVAKMTYNAYESLISGKL